MEIKNRVQLRWRLAAACAVLLWFAGLGSVAVDDYNVTHYDLQTSENTPFSPIGSSPDSRNSSDLPKSLKPNNSSNSLYLIGRPKPVPEKVVEVEPLKN